MADLLSTDHLNVPALKELLDTISFYTVPAKYNNKIIGLIKAAFPSPVAPVWKPAYNTPYWYFRSTGDVFSTVWTGNTFDLEMFAFGNCFPSEAAALIKLQEIKEILKK